MPKGEPPKNPKNCRTCNSLFMPKSGTQVFCTIPCKRQWYKLYGPETTERQYELISGNWEKYFRRLCARSFNRSGLSVDILLKVKDRQQGKCALTGVEMTCTLQKGVVCKTNASIDRIDPKGQYVEDNIHLVCAVVNKFRVDTPLNEFISWCRKVANHAVY